MTDSAATPAGREAHAGGASVTPFGLVYSVLLRQIVTRARLAGLGALALLLVVIGWAAGRSDVSLRQAVDLMGNLGLAVMLPVGALIFATASLADLREDRTLVFLWLRPMPAWVVPVAAVAASVTAVLPVTLAAAVLSGLVLGVDGSLVAGGALAVVAGSFAYCAVFVAFGLYVKRTLLWGLVYVLIWEGFIAGGGQGAARFAIRAYTRSIVADLTDVSIPLASFSAVTSVIVALGITIGATALAARRFASMDVD